MSLEVELDKLLNTSIRMVCKKYHFKSIMGTSYVVKDDFLYELIIISNENIIKKAYDEGVDTIITDNPLLAREIIYSKNTSTTLIEMLKYVFDKR